MHNLFNTIRNPITVDAGFAVEPCRIAPFAW